MYKFINILLQIAQDNALGFPTLNQFLDWEKIQKFLIRYICEKNQEKNKKFNILEALLLVGHNSFSIYDTTSNLRNIENSLRIIIPLLSKSDFLEIKNKLNNLGNTSFWDTATELWFASKLKEKDFKIKFDFPLQDYRKGCVPSNADVGIVNNKNEPIWLFDCITPTLELPECKDLKLEKGEFNEEPKKAIECSVAIIKNKFNNKFLSKIDYHPNANYGIFVALTKADDISAHLGTVNLLNRNPIELNATEFQFHPKLKYAAVGRFQEREMQKIEFVELISYKAKY